MFKEDEDHFFRTIEGDEIAFFVRGKEILLGVSAESNDVHTVPLDLVTLKWLDKMVAHLLKRAEKSK